MTERHGDTHRTDTHSAPDTHSGCQYPESLTEVCGRPVRKARGAGQPSKYCENHTRVQARRQRERLLNEAEAAERSQPDRPITAGVAGIVEVVRRMERLQVDLAEMVAEVTNPEALAREIANVQRDRDARVAQAEADRDAALNVAARARAERDLARELNEDAVATAEEAEAVHEKATKAVREAREAIARAEAERDTAREAQIRAEAERDAALAQAERDRLELAQLREKYEAIQTARATELRDLVPVNGARR